MKKQKQHLATFCTSALLALGLPGCAWLGVYKIDVSQGTPLTNEQVSNVKVGMSAEQVQYFLGSPNIYDPAKPEQWVYTYNFLPGTYGKQYNVPKVTQQNLIITLNQLGKVSQIEGAQNIPNVQKTVPSYTIITGKTYN